MANYFIGQKIFYPNSNYYTQKNLVDTTNPYTLANGADGTFAIVYTFQGSDNAKAFVGGVNYYLFFKSQTVPKNQYFNIKVLNKDNYTSTAKYNYYRLGGAQLSFEQSTYWDFYFSPNSGYDSIAIIFNSNADRTAFLGSETPILNSWTAKNLCSNGSIGFGANVKEIVKLGVNASPGLKIGINDSCIQIGPTGTYEIATSNISVYNFCFLPSVDDILNSTSSTSQSKFAVVDYIYSK